MHILRICFQCGLTQIVLTFDLTFLPELNCASPPALPVLTERQKTVMQAEVHLPDISDSKLCVTLHQSANQKVN